MSMKQCFGVVVLKLLLPAYSFSLFGWVYLCTHLVGSYAVLYVDYHEKPEFGNEKFEV